MLHHLLELFLEDSNNLIAVRSAHGTSPLHRRTAKEGEFSPTGHGDGDVGAGTNAGIHHDFGAAFELFCECGGRSDSRLALIELAAAVVGDDEYVGAEGEAEFGILCVAERARQEVQSTGTRGS